MTALRFGERADVMPLTLLVSVGSEHSVAPIQFTTVKLAITGLVTIGQFTLRLLPTGLTLVLTAL